MRGLERILSGYEQSLDRERQTAGLVWPLESALLFTGLKAMALPCTLHHAWWDDWLL
ncbi:hypothetical protein [Streptomyces sp. NBC_01320]|uniref:hypothetical protein n=1 Tax=Streptomyces sp. NBC_01320 TaxID=2903824 RepID=UPI002E0DB408|nr:hypothetical protein OG395_01025 [Streptomyces sp. NBC_01320]WSK01054.1 hypothetical protein OG395_54330 [Streptomyces sp. NBC_01320]